MGPNFRMVVYVDPLGNSCMQFIFSEVAALDLEATLIATAGGAGCISGYGNQEGRSSFQIICFQS